MKKYHRGRRRHEKKRRGRALENVILVIAIVIALVSGFQLFGIIRGYQKGRSEYDKIAELAVTVEKGKEDEKSSYHVDFDELKKINPDTVGWIRFYPEPHQIDYPIVQGTDNSLYLNKTFSANENTVGAIFMNKDNTPDFSDRNTIIFGHRMNDDSMFHDLAKYEDKSFWEANPYFYIYTPDGREITYKIFAAGVLNEVSDAYMTNFAGEEDIDRFLDATRQSAYDTGIDVDADDYIVTLSTCTKASNDERMVVRGVKVSEKQTKE